MFCCHFLDLVLHLWLESSRYSNWHYIKHSFASGTQLFDQDNIKLIFNDNVVKNVSDINGVIKTTGTTVIDRGRKFLFPRGLACSSGKSTKKSNRFVVRSL